MEFSLKKFLGQEYRYAQENYGDTYLKIPKGIWSDKKAILSCGNRGEKNKPDYWVNLSRGSFPFISLKELKENFIFFEH